MGFLDTMKNANAGFASAMKGANNAWGRVTADFFDGVGYIGPENFVNNTAQKLMVSASSLKDPVIFGKEDVKEVKSLFATSEWIKFRVTLNDGKSFVATFLTFESSRNGGKKLSMSLFNFEYWLASVIYK